MKSASFLWLLLLTLLAASGAEKEEFRTVDLVLDSGAVAFAAYQVEVECPGGSIVGVEGGEHPALTEPPAYDPKALRKNRIILAWTSLKPDGQLPMGQVRIATLHLMQKKTQKLKARLVVAGDRNARPIEATLSIKE